MPITTEELQVAAQAMARGNSPGPDGIVAEFYTYFSDLIGEELCHMIKSAREKGHLPKGVNKGLVALLFKGGEKERLGHWRPIMLLNVAQKISAKSSAAETPDHAHGGGGRRPNCSHASLLHP